MSETPPGLRIVPATASHREFVRRLSAEVFSRFGDYETLLPRMMTWPWVDTVVAEIDGCPVGFTMLSTERLGAGETELTAIAVEPDRQGYGVGTRLLAHVEEQTLQLVPDGRAAVRLTVAGDNQRARRVFSAAGYRVASGSQEPYPGGQPSLTMVKPLDHESA